MEKSAILMHWKDLLKAFYYIRDWGGMSSFEETVNKHGD